MLQVEFLTQSLVEDEEKQHNIAINSRHQVCDHWTLKRWINKTKEVYVDEIGRHARYTEMSEVSHECIYHAHI